MSRRYRSAGAVYRAARVKAAQYEALMDLVDELGLPLVRGMLDELEKDRAAEQAARLRRNRPANPFCLACKLSHGPQYAGPCSH